ncbi:uncharacterized protein LOC129333892 [Eublepharis macularius]|uniref:Gypsy retrotransposon integrase-like protein 1 n=1 Tax=Eublepharis macularius TaxID=481883 RepID=A0AA97JRT9_EUBMA|nr:uncharacterized protein LOC129333892 [Eublepharis macularius]
MDQAVAGAAAAPGPTGPPAPDLGQLGQWMAEQQVRLLRDLTAQQQESQATLLRGLAQALGGGGAGAPLGPSRGTPFQLTKLGETDEIDAYLEAFERTAEAAQWPQAQWAFILGPYLTGEAQAALRALPKEEGADYRALKAAILDRYEVTPDSYRLKFRAITYRKVDRPRTLVNALCDAAHRWLRPATEGEKGIVDQVVLEQLLNILPPKARQWVACSRPATLKEATALLENFTAAADPREPPREGGSGSRPQGPGFRGPEAPRTGRARPGNREGSSGPSRPTPSAPPREGLWGRPPPGPNRDGAPKTARENDDRGPCFRCGQRGHYIRDCPLMECDAGWEEAFPATTPPPRPPPLLILVEVSGRRLSAFLDSGSSVSMIRTRLLPAGLPVVRTATVACFHGHSETYPVVRVPLSCQGRTWEVELARVTNLPYPVLLGRDVPEFHQHLQAARGPEEALPVERQDNQPGPAPPPGADLPDWPADPTFVASQTADPTLEKLRDTVAVSEGIVRDPRRAGRLPRIVQEGGVWYRLTTERGREVRQLLVPREYREIVLRHAHDHNWAGHQGPHNTLARVLTRFFWPGVDQAVKSHCRTCETCQRTSGRHPPRAPLAPLPVIHSPFERVAMDFVGPLPRTSRGHRFILVLMDYATRYPEAIPMRTMQAPGVTRALIRFFAQVGLPREIVTDCGTPFTASITRQLCRTMGIRQIFTSIYHPQTDGLVERFNQTLKQMLRRLAHDRPAQWDLFLDLLLFAVRESPQASTGFTPFELVYGRNPRGILEVKEGQWATTPARPGQPAPEYVRGLRERLETVRSLARQNLEKAQATQKARYDRGTRARTFLEGDRVLVSRRVFGPSKQGDPWQGPFRVNRVLGSHSYEVQCGPSPRQNKRLHVNDLKEWCERSAGECQLADDPLEPPDGELPWTTRQPETASPGMDAALSPQQQEQLRALLDEVPGCFSTRPGRTNLAEHAIPTAPGQVARSTWRPLPRKQWDAVAREVDEMLRLGVIRPSTSEWRSPIVLVPKPDGSVRFCVDYREVNKVAKFDAYPMPRADVLIDQLGTARYLSALDLTKGYWQVPMAPGDQEKTAFATPQGLFEFQVMPFGLHGAAATFQRLVDRALTHCQGFATAYIDDILIYSPDWTSHLRHLRLVLQALRDAGLKANPTKSRLGFQELKYLGFLVGRGQLRPLPDKVASLEACPRPGTKKQLRGFLGLVGYYSKFIPQYASRASPLTDYLRKDQPNRVQWTPQGQRAFEDLKAALSASPVLRNPDFDKPFILQTDASDAGLGAVLSQEHEGQEHPVLFISRKLQPAEQKYAVVEKEALAVKWAVGALQYYLVNNPFTLVTDHAPLLWMSRLKDHNARVLRWYLSLLPFSFTIRHRPGKLHANADFLSRMFAEDGRPGTTLRGVCVRGAAVPRPRTPRPPPPPSPPPAKRPTCGPWRRPGDTPGGTPARPRERRPDEEAPSTPRRS